MNILRRSIVGQPTASKNDILSVTIKGGVYQRRVKQCKLTSEMVMCTAFPIFVYCGEQSIFSVHMFCVFSLYILKTVEYVYPWLAIDFGVPKTSLMCHSNRSIGLTTCLALTLGLSTCFLSLIHILIC